MTSIGTKIVEARKRNGMRQDELATLIGLTPPSLWAYENNKLKKNPDPQTLIRIAEALGDTSILSHYCELCPIRNKIFIRRFPELNNINTNPTVIVMKVKQELAEGIAALEPLVAKMLTKDFTACPEYQGVLEESLVQVMGTAQSLDILVHQFLIAGIISPVTVKKSLRRLQEWCEHRGHHLPDKSDTVG